MRKYLALLIFQLVGCLSFVVYGQDDPLRPPISMIIIRPDSISLHSSLRPLGDSLEQMFRGAYYSWIVQLERHKLFGKEDVDDKIQQLKSLEMDAHSVRYSDMISMFTMAELWSLFQESGTDLDIGAVSKSELFTYDLKKLADYLEVDYILTYKELSTPIEKGEPVLRITTELFSRRRAKVISTKTNYGYARFYTDNSGELQACSNDLECMFAWFITTSSLELFKIIKRESKK